MGQWESLPPRIKPYENAGAFDGATCDSSDRLHHIVSSHQYMLNSHTKNIFRHWVLRTTTSLYFEQTIGHVFYLFGSTYSKSFFLLSSPYYGYCESDIPTSYMTSTLRDRLDWWDRKWNHYNIYNRKSLSLSLSLSVVSVRLWRVFHSETRVGGTPPTQ